MNNGRKTNSEIPSKIPKELEQTFKEQRDKFFRLAYRYVGNNEDAEEIVQDAYMRALRGYANFRGECEIGNWIYGITRRLAINKILYNQRRFSRSKDSLEEIHELTSSEYSPRANLQVREFEEAFYKASENVPQKQREIIFLRFANHLEYSEIAEKLGIDIGTVKSRLSRGRKILLSQMRLLGTRRDALNEHDLVEKEDHKLERRLKSGTED